MARPRYNATEEEVVRDGYTQPGPTPRYDSEGGPPVNDPGYVDPADEAESHPTTPVPHPREEEGYGPTPRKQGNHYDREGGIDFNPAGPRATRPLPNVFGAPGQLGVGKGEQGYTITERIDPDGRVSGAELRIGRFLGLVTRPSRGMTPLGALADMKNFVVNKVGGALVQRKGFAAYTLPTQDISGDFVLGTNGTDAYWIFETEVPSTQTIKINASRENAADAKGILQTPFFPNSSTVSNSAVKWGESLSGITISQDPLSGTSVTFTGGEATADYYKYWILYNSTIGEAVYVTGSSKVSTTTTLTILEDAPDDWDSAHDIVLYRHFHDNLGFAPSYTDPVALQQGQNILFSGGQGSTVGYKPILSGYISKTYFAGASRTLSFAGTYVTEAEIKSTAGIDPQTAGTGTSTDNGLTQGYRWFLGFIFETDDGQLSQLVKAATNYITPADSDDSINTAVRISSRINKRYRKMHVVAGYDATGAATELEYGQYQYIRTVDLTAAGWTYTDATAEPGYWTKTETVTMSDWNARGSDLETFLGHTEANVTTASFSKGVFLNNRLFVAKGYDYNAAANFDDSVRYSVFSEAGVPQFNVLADIGDVTETFVEPGDPAVIRGIVRWEGKLFIVKDNSCHYVEVENDTEFWRLVTVARGIGTDIEDSIVVTPFGVVFAKTGEDIYIWDGGYPTGLARNWLPTYQAITPGWGWYDRHTKSYNVENNAASEMTWYALSFDATYGGFPIAVKHYSPGYQGPSWAVSDEDGDIIITVLDDTDKEFYQFDNSTTNDGGNVIQPYFKTAPIVLDEKHLVQYQWMHLIVPTVTGSSGTLTLKATTAGGVTSGAQSWANVTKTLNLHRRGFNDITGRGRRVEIEFNTNATLASFTAYQIDELGVDYDIITLEGDVAKTA